jgi:hypothetical protein
MKPMTGREMLVDLRKLPAWRLRQIRDELLTEKVPENANQFKVKDIDEALWERGLLPELHR